MDYAQRPFTPEEMEEVKSNPYLVKAASELLDNASAKMTVGQFRRDMRKIMREVVDSRSTDAVER